MLSTKHAVGVLLLGMMNVISLPCSAGEGAYIGLSVSNSDMQQGCSRQPSGCRKVSKVLRFHGGYQFSPRWGVELSHGPLGEAVLLSGAKASASGTDISLMLASPTFEKNLNSVVKLGLLKAKLDNGIVGRSAVSNKIIWGIGLQYQTSRNISVRAFYEDCSFVGDVTTGQTYIKLLTIGLLVGF